MQGIPKRNSASFLKGGWNYSWIIPTYLQTNVNLREGWWSFFCDFSCFVFFIKPSIATTVCLSLGHAGVLLWLSLDIDRSDRMNSGTQRAGLAALMAGKSAVMRSARMSWVTQTRPKPYRCQTHLLPSQSLHNGSKFMTGDDSLNSWSSSHWPCKTTPRLSYL